MRREKFHCGFTIGYFDGAFVPIDRDASVRQAGHGGGTVYATYASSSTRADEGDDYEMRASANTEDDAYEVPMNAEDDTYGIDSDSSSNDF